MPSQEQSDLPSPVAASEINRLHAKIFAALRTSIQDAIRIGELLSEEKRRAGHSNWLPWIKANLEFSECTARNYIRVYENRDRLKSANVADLTDAYCLLADRNNALVPDTKCQPQQASFTQTNCTLFDVSVETLENFRVLVDRYLEELSKICDRADGFQDILEALFLYRWVMEETGNLPELFAEHESDLSLFMRELERDQESFSAFIAMVLQTSSRTTRQHRKKSSPEKSSVGTDYSRVEGNSRFRALSSKSLDFRAILSGTLGTQFATPGDRRSLRGGIGCVKRNFRKICSFGTNADIIL